MSHTSSEDQYAAGSHSQTHGHEPYGSQSHEPSGSHSMTEPSSRSHPTIPLDIRITIQPSGSTFIPGNEGARRVTHAIKKSFIYKGAHCWGKVPQATRQNYFKEFEKLCVWDPQYDSVMYKLFCKKASDRYKHIMNDYHKLHLSGRTLKLGELPNRRDVWDTLVDVWESEAFKERSAKARANRKSNPDQTGIAIHRAGSRSIYEHKLAFEKHEGRPMNFFEGMQIPHPMNQATGKSTYGRTTDIYRKMHEAIESQKQQMSQEGSTGAENTVPTPIDENQLYLQVVGVNKGLVVGLGDYGRTVRNSYRGSSDSSLNSHPSEMESQLKSVTEKMKSVITEKKEEKKKRRKMKKACKEMMQKSIEDATQMEAMRRWMTAMSIRMGMEIPPEIGSCSGTAGGKTPVVPEMSSSSSSSSSAAADSDASFDSNE